MAAPPSRSSTAQPAPDRAGAGPIRTESQTRRVPPRSGAQIEPPAGALPPPPRPLAPTEIDVDVDDELPTTEMTGGAEGLLAAEPAPPASPPRPPSRPPRASPSAPPRPASPAERPSRPSAPLGKAAVEGPSRPSVPMGLGPVERPSRPSVPMGLGPVERPSRPSTPLGQAAVEGPSRPSVPMGLGPVERPSRPSAPLAAAAEAQPVERASWPAAVAVPVEDPIAERLSSPGPAPLDEPGPGSVISGRYRLEQVIGRGGMGAVWLARDTTLDIDVAVKLIRRDRAAPEARARLLQEARAAARIGHPSIVRIFDFGETATGSPFIVMELLHGESLSSVLARRQRLAPVVAVTTLLPVASALVAAHQKGIVHRDLKPDNILLVTNEAGALVPKLLDFGIARLLDSDTERRFTLAGEVLGSPDYMSPEQAKGEVDVGAPTDIWAFTVVLYEALTGRRPFQGQNYNALIMSIITNEPPSIVGLAAGDAELWSIVQRGLAKRSADRWQTMRDLGAALAVWAIEHGAPEDVAGTSLMSHWLSGGRQRTISVYPTAGLRSPVAAGPGAAAAPLPAAGQKPPLRMPAVAVETVTRPPFVPSRRRWGVVLAVLALAVIGLVAFLTSTPDPPPTVEAAAPSASPSAVPQAAPPPPSAAPEPEPAAAAPTASAAAPPPSAAAPGTPPRGPLPPFRPKKRTAPPVPKDIKF